MTHGSLHAYGLALPGMQQLVLTYCACRLHYIIAYSALLGALFLAWLVTALKRWRAEPIILPSKTSPAGKEANYKGTELAEAHVNETPRERHRPGWVPETPPPGEA